MLFYLDPPYYGSETDYGKDAFSRADFSEMAEQLTTLKGSFLLSINDRPEVREIFRAFAMEAVSTTYTISAGGASSAGELIIAGSGEAHALTAA